LGTNRRALLRADADRDPSLTATLAALLDAFTTEAPPEALDEMLGRLRTAAGTLGADSRAVDRAARRAVHAVHARRRNEHSLLALQETVAELGSLPEPGAVHEGI